MRSRRCFIEENFSDGKITFRVHHEVEFGTQMLQEYQSSLTWSILFFHIIHEAPIQYIPGLEQMEGWDDLWPI